MKVFESVKDIRGFLKPLRDKGSIGFVPTMGALHDGHLSLLSKCLEDNDYSVASIFVNPTQFNNKSDLEKYPRDLERDLQKLESKGCDVVFSPDVTELYPNGVMSEKFDIGRLDSVLEGKFRPGHFQGVMTIVKRFFEIVQPDRAYFGEKDFQQLQIIRKLVDIENMDVEIVPGKIIREENGLAMSSRNERLSHMEREHAGIIYQSLIKIKKMIHERSLAEARSIAIDMIELQEDMSVEYFEIVNARTLQPLEEWDDTVSMRACVAAYLNDIRLIDNMELNES